MGYKTINKLENQIQIFYPGPHTIQATCSSGYSISKNDYHIPININNEKEKGFISFNQNETNERQP